MKYRNKLITLLLIIPIIISVNFIDNKSVYAAGEVVELKDIPVGDIVYDDTVNWTWKEDGNYSGITMKTAPVEWLVVAHRHFNTNATVLVSKDCVALYNYDSNNSNSNIWSSSELRTWLRGTFRNHLSDNFKNNIVEVTTYSEGAQSTDNIFILSQIELGGDNTNITGNHGSAITYFNSDARRVAQAYIDIFDGPRLQNHQYWTRSPVDYGSSNVRHVSSRGHLNDINACNKIDGVRPALNLKDTVRIQKQSDGRWKILWNQDPTINLTSPTSNSSLNNRQAFLKEVV